LIAALEAFATENWSFSAAAKAAVILLRLWRGLKPRPFKTCRQGS